PARSRAYRPGGGPASRPGAGAGALVPEARAAAPGGPRAAAAGRAPGGHRIAGSPVLYVIACAAGPAGNVGVLVREAQDEGWTVCVIATPNARAFLDMAALAELTGWPVRIENRAPGETSPL